MDATTDVVSYFVDGTLRTQHIVATEPALYVYLSHNGQGVTPPLEVDQLDLLPSYVQSGIHTSCALDAGRQAIWESLNWAATLPASTTLTVSARSSTDGAVWSAWSDVPSSGGALAVPTGRYLQYRLSLATTDTLTSPRFDAMTATYR